MAAASRANDCLSTPQDPMSQRPVYAHSKTARSSAAPTFEPIRSTLQENQGQRQLLMLMAI